MTLAERLRDAVQDKVEADHLRGDLLELGTGEATSAAVLVAVTDRAEPGPIVRVRREHLRTQAGKAAFPGGRVDPGEDAVAAALREAKEELTLDPAAVE